MKVELTKQAMQRTMNRRSTLLLILAAAALPGCVSSGYRERIGSGLDEAEYTLASGDRLRVIVFGQDNLSNLYSVDGSGRITMPLIASVQVSGLTTSQATDRIASRLRDGFIREPKVTVEIETYRPFYILGEVARAGQFPFATGMTVQTAIAIAGGFTPRAAQSYASLSRQVADEIVTVNVPINEPIRPGDTIVVKERWF
jgi:polysaccharide biosynthesis/export protein